MNGSPDLLHAFKPPARLNMSWLVLDLFGAMAAWIVQVYLCVPLAANACYPYLMPVSEPIWSGLTTKLTLISLSCLAFASWSAGKAWGSWHQLVVKADTHAVDDTINRFLLKISIMSSFIFIVAILFNLCAILLVSPCGS